MIENQTRRNFFIDNDDYNILQAETDRRKTTVAIFVRFILACVLHNPKVRELIWAEWLDYDKWRKAKTYRSNATDYYRAKEGDVDGEN